jgi:hypothetical protein
MLGFVLADCACNEILTAKLGFRKYVTHSNAFQSFT